MVAGLRRSLIAIFIIEILVGIRPVMRTRRRIILNRYPNIFIPCQVVTSDLKIRVI
jgi:hypothetical protein